VTTREEGIRREVAKVFWNDMARPASERTALSRDAANSLICSCLLNRGIKWSLAMSAVDQMKIRTGYTDTLLMMTSLSPEALESVLFDDTTDYTEVGGRNGSLHRYRYMARYLSEMGCRIRDEYSGDARNLYRDEPTGAQLLARVMDFKGIGSKIGAMWVRICVLSHKVQLWDTYASMDVSPDRHVMAVMSRLGLVSENPTPQEVINKAREMSPLCPVELEGMFALSLDYHCSTSRPACSTSDGDCPVVMYCPTASRVLGLV